MAIVSIEKFVDDITRELQERNVAIFAGAGLSVASGFVDWKGLLKPLADELRLDVDREHDLVRVAQYHVNHHGSNRNDLTNAILNGFSRKQAQVTDNHRILARLPISSYWTTNCRSSGSGATSRPTLDIERRTPGWSPRGRRPPHRVGRRLGAC